MLKRSVISFICIALICVTGLLYLWPSDRAEGRSSVVRVRLASRAEHRQVASDSPRSFAYVMYATSEAYLCNAIINAIRLRGLRITPEADIVVLVDRAWLAEANETVTRRLVTLNDLMVNTIEHYCLEVHSSLQHAHP